MTPAQRRCAELAARGYTSKQIAVQMHTSDNSVRQLLHRVYIQIGLEPCERQRPDPRQLTAALRLAAAFLSVEQK